MAATMTTKYLEVPGGFVTLRVYLLEGEGGIPEL